MFIISQREAWWMSLPLVHSLGFYGNGISLIASGQSLGIRVLDVLHTHHSAKTDSSERDSGRLVGHKGWHWFSPFDLSSWWRLVSSRFLIRTSCCKVTHANDYYFAWPDWAVSVSGSPNISTRVIFSIFNSFTFSFNQLRNTLEKLLHFDTYKWSWDFCHLNYYKLIKFSKICLSNIAYFWTVVFYICINYF